MNELRASGGWREGDRSGGRIENMLALKEYFGET